MGSHWCKSFGGEPCWSNLDGATLTDACLWETQRAGWSIKGFVYERIHLDVERKDRKTYGIGEVESFSPAGASLNTLVSPGIKVDLEGRSVALSHGRTKNKNGRVLEIPKVVI